MRTLNVYRLNELSDEAKRKALIILSEFEEDYGIDLTASYVIEFDEEGEIMFYDGNLFCEENFA